MPAYTPTLTINSTPPVDVKMAGALSYNEFVNSLGQFCYWIKKVWLQCDTYQQLQQTIAYNILDSTGHKFLAAIVPTVDPYQLTASLELNLEQQGVVLNGLSSLSFNLMPNEFMIVTLITDEVSNRQAMNMISKSNYDRVEDLLGNLALFNEYSDSLP